ncbi:hypothetical protein GLYMA_02G048700v4 [Glycine max]|uniref:Uncharacterized protein n=1 Tax=Glycine max TaxID=3847 RepID=I1JCH9_SOYBN|nr:chromatin-remodeling ATPase INO80 [Glycine max]KAG5050851.1 hypothetical protein JHK87_003049 [Glycine soja]KAG5062191.1 hypothetical protein JHK85_003374 [Glycine max]KAG5079144.1 hypothetical protein JHK86_003209 [Glycine max]KAH1260257.1 hypothetical protein GmHk_02G003427 [Glycine max]KRH69788.1 hypothetical protein GLYMA_02G048700v4 [Glycine max]|eukprot:XP_003520257.1 chromatin-remodeling ATPase INO80 [Glycine max]
METPSSTARRITRSQTASNNIPVSRKKNEECSGKKSVSKTRQRSSVQQQQDNRCALVDISNDSPIVGLANGKDMIETPLSSTAKKKTTMTPGSGEALLRGQVKTLLQRVEEEAVISKLSMEIVAPFLKLANSSSVSPMSLLAPTPANTPQVPNLSEVSPPSCVLEEQLLISRAMNEILEGKNNENAECEKSVITRSLLLDFSDKSEVSECSSEVTYQEVTQGSVGSGSSEDDGASIWSIQVNASTHDEDEDDEEMGEEEEDYYEDDGDDEECYVDGVGLSLDELCAGMNNISVNENKNKGCGKHTRFVYDSEDDEIVEKVVECCAESDVMHLKGLPTPKGKHLRFPEEEENSDL